MMKINQLILLLSILLFLNGAVAQNTFSFELESEYVKCSEAAIEYDNGNIITILSQAIGQDYTPQIALHRAGLLIFNPNGKQLLEQQAQAGKNILKLDGLPAGAYVLLLTQDGKLLESTKVLVE